MKISVIGLGWLGAPLAHSLVAAGHTVMGTTRNVQKQAELKSFRISAEILERNVIPSSTLLDVDVCVLNIPPFARQLEWFKSWPWQKKTHVIFVSSTSVYGDTEGLKTEESPLVADTENAAELIAEEKWIQQYFSQWTILRASGLVGELRHPGKFLSGRKDIKGPLHPVNLIHQKDMLGFIELVIKNKIAGSVFNVSSDESKSKKVFYQQFAKAHHLTLPEFDEADVSSGKKIDNSKLKSVYQLQRTVDGLKS